MRRTSLPRSSSAYAIASWDPIESPSGRAWDVMRKRRRSLIASQAWVSASFVARVVTGLAICRGSLRFQLLEDLLDSIVPRDRFVIEELELGHPPKPEALSKLPFQERGGALERAGALALRLLVAQDRVVHARELQVWRDANMREREKSDARILHVARQQLSELAADLIADTLGTG